MSQSQRAATEREQAREHKPPCQGPPGEHLAKRGKPGESRRCLGCGTWMPVVLEDAGQGAVSCRACESAVRHMEAAYMGDL
jgi:hypothetical protein